MVDRRNFRLVTARNPRYIRRMLRSHWKVLPVYFEGFEDRKVRLKKATPGSYDQEAALYDIRSSIVDPLAEMGYVMNSDELLFTQRTCLDDVKKLDQIIADIKAKRRLPYFLGSS